MNTKDVIVRYYKLANAGSWDAWCDLFAEDLTMREQLAGTINGRETLREMMRGFPAMYRSFKNTPREIIVEGESGAAVSHLVAVTPSGDRIVADVMNHFRVVDGLITYMANFHDTVPFQVLNAGADSNAGTDSVAAKRG